MEVVGRDQRSERAAALRAGLITSAIYNVHRKKGAPMLKATDFIKEPTKIISAEAMHEMVVGWARRTRAVHEKAGGEA